MGRNTPIPPKRLLLFKVLAWLLPVLLFAGVYYGKYRQYLKQLYAYDELRGDYEAPPEFPLLTQGQLLNLGWAHPKQELHENQSPQSSYIYHSIEKPAGLTRIGVFGCSFVQGNEAGKGYDFPSLLGQKFGADSVQVINFGSGSYGLHQSYLLFEYLGIRYGLDIIIVNPYRFHRERDNTFVYPGNYFPVHARYILPGDSLRLVPVLGNSRQEAARLYHRFFRPRQYLSYDIQTPGFLRPISADFNPFYYTGASRNELTWEEMDRTYERILERMAAHCKRLLVVCNDFESCQLQNKLGHVANIEFFDPAHLGKPEESMWAGVDSLAHSIYRAPGSHFSPMGNDLIANELYGHLTNNPQTPPLLVFNGFADIGPTFGADGHGHGFADCDSVYFELGDVTITSLQKYTPSRLFNPDSVLLHHSEAKSLLLWTGGFSDLAFLPVGEPLHGGERLSLHYVVDGTAYEVGLGRMEAFAPNFFRLEAGGAPVLVEEKDHILLFAPQTGNRLHECIHIYAIGQVESAALLLDGKPLGLRLKAVPNLFKPNGEKPKLPPNWWAAGQGKLRAFQTRWGLKVEEGETWAIRMTEDGMFDLHALGQDTITLNLVMLKGGEPSSHPLFKASAKYDWR